MDSYSVPAESHKVLLDGIINNPLHAYLPTEIKDAASNIEYTGTDAPSIPINWRFAESISAIKGFQASMLNVLLKKKYGLAYQKIVIDTDHAQLFFMSILMNIIDPLGANIRIGDPKYTKYFPNGDKFQGMAGSPLKITATNVYKTKDGRYYHLHGSMDVSPIHKALGINPQEAVADYAGGCKIYQDKISQLTAKELDTLVNDQHRQAGTICWSTEEYKASEHGKANAHVGLYELHHVPNPKQAPRWWTPVERRTSPERPLFGLKVVDLTRIIASPTITRELAELGASVMRITSPNVTDMTVLLCDLAWGKWNAYLDLKKPEDRARLRALIEESDVVVDGYRPGVMEKWGFGKDDILGFFKDKERGIIYVHENCYGWNGPWAHRSGWQQISDAVSSSTSVYYDLHSELVFAVLRCISTIRKGNGERRTSDACISPTQITVIPLTNSIRTIHSTGAAGATGVLQALIEQSEKGGSFVLDVALNYYSQWLVNSCSTYPSELWDALWTRHGRMVFRHTDNMLITFAPVLGSLTEKQAPILNPNFLEVRENRAIGVPVRTVKPILTFPEGVVKLGYNVGSRGNGLDQPVWPEDLTEEIVKG